MAGIIGHIYCALTLAASGIVPITDERAFVAGTIYPDIRIMHILAHETIGKENPTWQNLLDEPNDFQKGVILHKLIEKARIDNLEKPLEPRIAGLLIKKEEIMRFYEDSLIYPRIKNWPKIIGYFDFVLPQERTMNNLPDEIIQKWHTFLRTYCSQKPGALSSHWIFNELPHIRTAIPLGLPSLASKAYVAIAFKTLKKSAAPTMITRFYDNYTALIMDHRK